MSDGWTDKRGRTLINFLVYCSRGLCFIKSVDAIKEIKTAKVLFKMFDEVIKWIGVDNVVQVVTDNASNYLKCGKVIHMTYPHIYWTPCAAHCINLILKDIAAMPHVSELFAKASKISVFVYNHQPVLNWLKAREGWKEIVRPVVTRFTTHFKVLKSTYGHKADLRVLFGSEFYIADSSSSTQKAMNVEKIVSDNMFWGYCLEIVKVVTPIMKLLRFVDSDEKPSLGYVYKGMTLIIEGIKNIYPDNESKYKPFIDIVEKRFDKHFRGDMHRAAYYFNPALAYNHTTTLIEFVKSAILNLFELKTYCTDDMAAVKELKIYEETKGSFGQELAIRGRSVLHPDVWWSTFGDSAPTLQKIAIRLLSQTSTSSGCERNWSVFERIRTDRRNKLEEDKLCDLVFVNYNLKLKNRYVIFNFVYDELNTWYTSLNVMFTWRDHYNTKKLNTDPFDSEWISSTDFWVLDDQGSTPTPELNYEELMAALDEEMGRTTIGADEGTSRKRRRTEGISFTRL
ncbi:hypothetical protein LINPERPRIM_LOCUS31383 [Linum perenne]